MPRTPSKPNARHLLNRQGRFDTVTAVAISQTDAEGQPTIPTHPETEEHLLEVVATIFAMPIRRVGGLGALRLVRIRPVEHNGRGVLMQPGRRDRIDL